MRPKRRGTVHSITLAVAVINVGLGLWLPNYLVVVAGIYGVGYVLLRRRAGRRRETSPTTPRPSTHSEPRPVPAAQRIPAQPDDPDSLARQMLAQDRYGILLRPQIAHDLEESLYVEVLEAIRKAMALVPDGEVVLGKIDDALDDGKLDEKELAEYQGRVVAVDRFFLDRYQVTNRQYFEFVAGGGYEQPSLWDESVLPAVLDFVDRTGKPGPRFWRDGYYERGQGNHPVVGVCWHEALAYARWVGKRLPTDAEWVKAAAWPVQVSPTIRMQRRYPWGENLDQHRANVWGFGPATTVPVDDYPDGVSVGGVHQLIGNVWEWTSGNLRLNDNPDGELVLEAPMKSLRGGAFDTYFDRQATCHFQSGDTMLSRKRNIGFRCAVGVCDLLLARALDSDAEPAQDTPVEEVSA